jgi:sulfoxide reductase heme-binding subunit YedZ
MRAKLPAYTTGWIFAPTSDAFRSLHSLGRSFGCGLSYTIGATGWSRVFADERSIVMTLVDQINTVLRKLPEWSLYILGSLPPAWLLWQGVTGGLGVDPVKVMEHQLGLWGLQLLIATLMVSPLRRYAGLNFLKFRRAFGLLAFSYIVLHLTVWVVLDMGLLWGQILEDLVKRWYIIIGMVALLLMIPLVWTSRKSSIRKMGRKWTSLHRITYVVALLGGIHFIMQEKVWTTQALTYFAVIVTLVALRFVWNRKRLPRTAA